MKVKENVKTFVEKNKKAIVAGVIGAGSVALVGIGYKLGMDRTFGDIERLTKIDLTQDFAYNASEKLIKHFAHDDAMVDALKQAGFTSIDDTLKAVVIIQKK